MSTSTYNEWYFRVAEFAGDNRGYKLDAIRVAPTFTEATDGIALVRVSTLPSASPTAPTGHSFLMPKDQARKFVRLKACASAIAPSTSAVGFTLANGASITWAPPTGVYPQTDGLWPQPDRLKARMRVSVKRLARLVRTIAKFTRGRGDVELAVYHSSGGPQIIKFSTNNDASGQELKALLAEEI